MNTIMSIITAIHYAPRVALMVHAHADMATILVLTVDTITVTATRRQAG